MAPTLSFSDMPKAEFTPQIGKSLMSLVFSSAELEIFWQ
jgi:hypothetical protein